jgi:hypothetical protein
MQGCDIRRIRMQRRGARGLNLRRMSSNPAASGVGSRQCSATRVDYLSSMFVNLRSALRPRDKRERTVPIGTFRIIRTVSRAAGSRW